MRPGRRRRGRISLAKLEEWRRRGNRDSILKPPLSRLKLIRSPIEHRAVFEAVDWQACRPIRKFRGQCLVDIHAVPGRFARIQIAALEGIGMWKYRIGFGGMAHVFLDAEIRYPQIEMQRCAHADRRQISSTVESSANAVQFSEMRNATQMTDAACMNNRRADVVDEALVDELLRIPH